jgi:ABC-type nitrate/sulfonate/bicarbonate transport system permease component
MQFQDSLIRISQNTLLFFNSTFVSFISILLGFFFATIISTVLAQTGDWGILSSGFLVALLEIISKLFYDVKKKVISYKKVTLEF